MAGGNTKWVDTGWQKILVNMAKLGGTRLQVGIVGGAAHEQSTTGGGNVGQAALVNEFGSRRANIPERSFMRATQHDAAAESTMEKLAMVSLHGNVDAAFHEAGRHLAELMRDKIYHHGNFVGNAASTVKKKGFDHPLMDSSQLADAIGHQLVRANAVDIVDAAGEGGDYEAFSVSAAESGGE